MIFQHKKIHILNKNFKNIVSNILVMGGGRWAIITINELLYNFKNLKNIYIITNNKNITKNFSKEFRKKIIVKKNLKQINFRDVSHAIIVNKNSDHFPSAKKLLKNNLNILVEKPFVKKFSEFKTLKKISQNKKKLIHISMPFFFSYYFFYIKKYIDLSSKELIFNWHDPLNDKRYGKIKKYDPSVSYLEDTIYHIYGILNCLFGQKKMSLISIKNEKDNGLIQFSYGKFKIKLVCSRNSESKRVRSVDILSNKKIFSLDYANDNNINIIKNGVKKKIKFKFSQKTLKYQLFNFLNEKKYSKKYNLNDIRNLDNLFNLLKNF